MNVVDLYAGAGGWDVAARRLGFDPLGIEMDADACATREAAGMPTLHADITTLDPLDFGPVDGLIASPPCQSFSVAGKRAGLDDPRGELVWTPWTWAERLRPRWVACEQVPTVLDIWREIARRLEGIGHYTAVGLLRSEMFGVPQTRTRAILLAHRERPVTLPEPTHQRYVHGVAQGDPEACGHGSLFSDELLPWVSMAEALGWGMADAPMTTLTAGNQAGHLSPHMHDRLYLRHPRGEGMVERHGEREPRPASHPAMTVTGKERSWEWVVRPGQRGGDDWDSEITRPVDEPAPTVGTKSAGQWVIDRPATPGHHDETKRSFGDGAIRITRAVAAALQTFPPDHPWQGSTTSIHRQIGNAIPSLLAEAVLRQVAT